MFVCRDIGNRLMTVRCLSLHMKKKMLKMTQLQVCNIQLKTPGAETET